MEGARLSWVIPDLEQRKNANKMVPLSSVSEPLFSAPGLSLGLLSEMGSNLSSILQMWKLRFKTLSWVEFIPLEQRAGS